MPTLHRLGEFGVIRRFAQQVRVDRSVVHGIGDDAAVIHLPGRRYGLFASDMLVEGVHFRRGTPGFRVGWKALGCNISDIAAMGGVPRYATVSLGLPRSASLDWCDAFGRGLRAIAKRFGVNLVGGDTVRSPRIVVDVAIWGEVEPRHLVLRSGAVPGDWLCVTGRLGDSYRSGKHLRFVPRLREARYLVPRAKPRAMMDLSDGLASDLQHLAAQSGVGIVVDAAMVPRTRGATLQQALHEGEDFELVMALPPETARRVLRRHPRWLALRRIGTVVRAPRGVWLEQGGRRERLLPKGFKHF